MRPGTTRQIDYVDFCGNYHRNCCGGIRHRLQRRAGVRCGSAGFGRDAGGSNRRIDAGPYSDGCANCHSSAYLDAPTHLDTYPHAGADVDSAAYLDSATDGYPAPNADSDAPANLHPRAYRYSDSPKTGSYATLPQCALRYVLLGKRATRFLDNVSRQLRPSRTPRGWFMGQSPSL